MTVTNLLKTIDFVSRKFSDCGYLKIISDLSLPDVIIGNAIKNVALNGSSHLGASIGQQPR